MNLSLTQRLIRELPPRAFLLDLGCGTGRHALELARAGHRVVGIDLDVDAVETALFLGAAEAIKEAGSPRFAAGEARALPFKDESFDAILCMDVLHWSLDAAAFAAAWDEAWRALRPRGLWAARLLLREENPGASPRGDGRYRLGSGAEWFLAERATLDARARSSGAEWVESPVPDGNGAARFILRKP